MHETNVNSSIAHEYEFGVKDQLKMEMKDGNEIKFFELRMSARWELNWE